MEEIKAVVNNFDGTCCHFEKLNNVISFIDFPFKDHSNT